MARSFRFSPVIEIIAELRWGNPMRAPGPPPILRPEQVAPFEAMALRWVAKMAALGYEEVERLVPHGLPLLLHEPTVRLKPKTGAPQTTLFQLGPQLFTANAIPPYRCWGDFAPRVAEGVAALLAARTETDGESRLFVSLRYIDAFRDGLRQGLSVSRFLTETLGVRLSLPEAIRRHGLAGAEPRALIQVALPCALGTLRLQFAEGEVAGESALVMDMTAALDEAIEPEPAAVMKAFEQAHALTHDVFVELSAPIQEEMQPETEEPE